MEEKQYPHLFNDDLKLPNLQPAPNIEDVVDRHGYMDFPLMHFRLKTHDEIQFFAQARALKKKHNKMIMRPHRPLPPAINTFWKDSPHHPQHVYHQILQREAKKNIPLSMIENWLTYIQQKVPEYLIKKYPLILHDMQSEFLEEYDQVMYNLCFLGVVKSSEGTEYPTVTIKPFRPGFSENYAEFVLVRQLFQKRLLVTHKTIRKIVCILVNTVPDLLIDFRKYRKLGPLSITAWKNVLSNDLVDAEYLLRVNTYDKIVDVFKSKNCLDKVPQHLTTKFFKLATCIVTTAITMLLKRTLEHLLSVIRNVDEIPYLSFDVLYEEGLGIILLPPTNTIIKAFDQVVDEVLKTAQKFKRLEAMHLQKIKNEFMKVELDDIYVNEIRSYIMTTVTQLYECLNGYKTELVKTFLPLYDKTLGMEITSFLKTNVITFRKHCEKMQYLKKFLSILSEMVENEYYEYVRLNQTHLITMMKSFFNHYAGQILRVMVDQQQNTNRRLCERFDMVAKRVLTVPRNTEELVDLGIYLTWASTDFLAEMKENILRLLEETAKVMEWTTLTEGQINANAATMVWLVKMKDVLSQSATLYEATRFDFMEVLAKTIENLKQIINQLFQEASMLNLMDHPDMVYEYTLHLKEFLGKIRKCDKIITWVNKEEKLFESALSAFPELEELKNIITNYGELVFLTHKWYRTYRAWMDGDFEFIDSKYVEDFTEDCLKDLVKMQKNIRNKHRQQLSEGYKWRLKGNVDDNDFQNLPSAIKLSLKAIEHLKAFRQYVPLVVILCNPDLRKRHWDEMKEVAGFDITPDAGTTLRKLINMNLDAFVDKFEIISIGATKEKLLKENLDKMLQEWADLKFTVNFWKDTKIAILSAVDDVQAILDDHYVKTLQMRGSAFVKPFEEEVKVWYEKLVRMMKTIDEWGKVQAQWLYLLPIFSSPDIIAQMPEEGRLFQDVDQTYVRLMGAVQRDPLVLNTAGALGVFENLERCTVKLEKINDGVASYLEKKRLFFPRFFFLSNDEMLEILSETKDPKRVQPHLKKCFEGINKLEFDEDLRILAMISAEGEKIGIVAPIPVKEAGGSVEKWLVQVEEQMMVSLAFEIKKSHRAYPEKKRKEWVIEWAGQVVLCVAMIYWTAEVHDLLKPRGLELLRTHHESLQSQLNDVVELVRGKLTKLERITLGALVVLDVHAKDVTEELVEKKVQSNKDFQWLAQLRYYMETMCKVRIINATVNYGYEYLGNTPRLVITPLTDRCYRTLMGAYHLHLNGAPEGPAGTGKTETTKDLAKALAVQCVVFNCSDGLDYIAMGKFFKGLASTGAWACFDEFNRIELEVLSVIAQQILCIVQAVRAGLKKFIFEGTELTLNPACYVCITMNPGYAGRSELPDNLKVLFRTVAMMVPDYAMIGEISLYSYGFVDARSLSVKIVTTYRLCSEQLSSQNHYDYGMRAVKTVLAAAGNLKLKFPDEKEDILLLRSIIDVNLPKFLSHDVPLFEGIISDLFPSVVLPAPNYDTFLSAMNQACNVQNLQATDFFMTKVIQTYEMMIVRHGFMLVGEPYGGKTSVLKVLARTLENMENAGEAENRVQYEVINPKAITMGQLYGQFDPISYEWTDGVVAVIFRRFSVDPSLDRKWVIFDGPVDAVWIENMNTVLDDNKKLCLTSGEVIQQTSSMSMIFEVMDLAQASPATVSRCGMIYLEPSTLGWKPLVISWIQVVNDLWREGKEQLLEDLFTLLATACLDFVKKNCYQMSSAGVSSTVTTCMHLVTMLMEEAVSINEDHGYIDVWLQASFLYACVWSFGGSLDNTSRLKYDVFLKELWKAEEDAEVSLLKILEKIEIPIPFEGTLYDYVYNFKSKGSWKFWPEQLKGIRIEETINIQQTVVPTIESVRIQYLMQKHIDNNIPLLVVGPTGTGKSFYMQDMLMSKLSGDLYVPVFITFTAQTTANQTQELIIAKLNKRRKGLYGPPKNMRSVILIDDMNMPAKEIYGAQPPIELIRQFFDHKHWYDLKDTSKIFLVDVLMLAAMGPPGGSRQDVYKRFLRHYCIYTIDEFTDESMTKIYTNILLIGLRRNGFATEVMSSIAQIISATLDMYKSAMKDLLPTPAKSHYVFNLRDFSRLIQGCSLLKKESAESKKVFVKLWVHEILRVFYDRLVEDSDRTWLYKKLRECVSEHFKEKFDSAMDSLPQENGVVTEASMNALMFGNYMDPDAIDEDRKYEEVPSLAAFKKIADDAMDEYNATHKAKMDIVLFRYALEHLSRICRIIAMPGGSGLLVGISGSGRQSLAKLASVIYATVFFQPEITKAYGMNEWRDDLKQVLRTSGGMGKDTTFLFTEAQIKENVFLQDIESILNSGEVPNLLAVDEQQEILELVRLAAQGGNRNLDISVLQVFSFFTNRCKQKLHMLLCFSPIGSSFRNRLRLYPSLVNCCTIDWFMTWPEDALEMVAQRYLAEVNLNNTVKAATVVACKYFHVVARNTADDFFTKEGRKTYVTSAAYLELIRSFTELNTAKQEEIMLAKQRYLGGLDKLLFAAEQIATMQTELSALRPQLEDAAKSAVQMLQEIEHEQDKVANTTRLVKDDEKVAKIQAAEAQELKHECEVDLQAAIPVLEDALAALNTLKPADITLVKSMKNPPAAIKTVMAAVCVMKDVKPARVRDPSTGRMINDYWIPSQKILGDMYFLQSLREYDKDNINPSIMKTIRAEYLPNANFKPEIVAKASSAAEGLVKWIIAMDVYDRVIKVVAPKKAKLQLAEDQYNETMALLDAKREQLQKLKKQLNELRKKLENVQIRKEDLEKEVTNCRNKLERAEKLIGGLGGEKSRWSQAANNLQDDYESLPGNILICCGIIGYLSPYTSLYRIRCIDDWHKYVQQLKIPCSSEFSFRKVLGSDIKIQSWNISGLPTDTFSIDNGIIVDNSRRYSLLVDPQGQANRWIKTFEKANNIAVVKLSNPTYMNIIHDALENGFPVLIENINEELEAPLEPILQKQIFQQGGKKFIKLGDAVLEFSKNFRLYMTSKLRNPHYLPEVINLVTLVNFALTLDGLSDQLLGMVIAKERSDLEETRQKLIVQSAANEAGLKEIEDSILITISAAGNILEDEHAIDVLDSSKILANSIKEKQESAKVTARNIDTFRESYQPVACNCAVLYYCISDLPNVDPMYQYSLQWFLNIFKVSLETSKQSREIQKRMDFIESLFTTNLYSNVCRSLFEKDKLLFSFILCSKIMMSKNKLNTNEFRFFLTGGVAFENKLENPAASWLSQKSWDEICRIGELPAFKDLLKSFTSALPKWHIYYDEMDPQEVQMPYPWETQLDSFQKLVLIRVLRPDKILVCVTKFIKTNMGLHFISPPAFNIASSYQDSDCVTPLIFILSPGADPMSALLNFAAKMDKQLNSISLGQGQGPIARGFIEQGQEDGSWVCLQNCHLAVSWMPVLEKLWEEMDQNNTNPSFRLWITSYPSDKFPTSILQSGVKMTNEPPTGLQQNLLRSYQSDPVKEPEFYEGCPGKEKEFVKLLYGLCFFHAVVQERRKFGPIGWNIPYGFNESDFQISVQQLQMFINEQPTVPFDAITYLTGECNYGGRVTDDWDRRALNTILASFINKSVITATKYLFCELGAEYGLPQELSYDKYVEHIKNIPTLPPVEVFGLHMNSGITRDLLYARQFLESIVLVEGGATSGEGGKADFVLYEMAEDILNKIPPSFNIEQAMIKFPVLYEESMNTVLVQEMDRFNRLLRTICSSLINIQKAVKGFVVMSPELEAAASSVLIGKVPAAWAKVSYPSLKPLGGYINDFTRRLEMLQEWYMHGKPTCFWLPGFFFTQAFLTGVMQNYARKYRIPIDLLTFDFSVTTLDFVDMVPPDGCFIYGMFLDGARWDRTKDQLEESIPKVLWDVVPALLVSPLPKTDLEVGRRYICPLYKTSERRGVLSTTGHSTNYVLPFLLNTSRPVSHWIKRGVAMLCQLDD